MVIPAKPAGGKECGPTSTGPERRSDADALWRSYKRARDGGVRQELILRYAHLVKYVAGRVAVALPPSVEFDDLLGYGTLGLMDAVEKYDPSRGVKFETYALSRIRGAIIDGLRAMDWVPRSVRQKARDIEETMRRLERELGRSATDQEIAAALGLSLRQFGDLLAEVAGTTLTSLDELWRPEEDADELPLRDRVEDSRVLDPQAAYEDQELREELSQAIAGLSERERLVIALYYYEGLTLKEIGRVLEVTEARVCQIHSKAILRLRARLLA